MLSDDVWDLEAVNVADMPFGAYYPALEEAPAPAPPAPPPGSGRRRRGRLCPVAHQLCFLAECEDPAPCLQTVLFPRPRRAPLDFTYVASGGVAVDGAADVQFISQEEEIMAVLIAIMESERIQ